MRKHLSYANVTATLALFVAVSGTGAYAASHLAPRSVGEPQLRPGAVSASKIRKNAVTAPKIKSLAVKRGKLANESVTAAKLATGSVATGALQDGVVSGTKIAPDAVTGDKVVESTLARVPRAERAEIADVAESANPASFGHVTKEGTLDPNQSKDIAQVRTGSLPGIYCVTAAGFNPRGAQVTPEFEVSGEVDALVRVGGTGDCPAPAVEVQTFSAGARAKMAFFVLLYR